MSSVITERIQAYDLLTEERVALSAVLHRIEDERKKTRKPKLDTVALLHNALRNAIICRGIGMDNFNERLANIAEHLASYRNTYKV